MELKDCKDFGLFSNENFSHLPNEDKLLNKKEVTLCNEYLTATTITEKKNKDFKNIQCHEGLFTKIMIIRNFLFDFLANFETFEIKSIHFLSFLKFNK